MNQVIALAPAGTPGAPPDGWSAAMAQGWLAKTPSDFIFTAKVWQKFTHPSELGRDGGLAAVKWPRFDQSDVARFADGMAPLVESRRLGALLFQYPASFACDRANVERLEMALGGLPISCQSCRAAPQELERPPGRN